MKVAAEHWQQKGVAGEQREPRNRPSIAARGQMACEMAADGASVRRARERCAHALTAWRIPRAIDDTLYVVSELVTNGVVHTPGLHIELVLTYGDGLLLVEVRDSSAEPPALVRDTGEGEGGRGLQLVHALSSDWGWCPLGPDRKSVWALLAVRRAEFAAVTAQAGSGAITNLMPVAARRPRKPPPARRGGDAVISTDSPAAVHITGTLPGGLRLVVLYVRADVLEDVQPITASLRAFAEQVGLEVVEALYDVTCVDSHRVTRYGWQAVVASIHLGSVNGIVCPHEDDIAYYREDKALLRRWVLGNGAFAIYPEQPEETREDGA
ncbi:ATP-binding protein [Streptomyces sp. NBC_00237]|uniref:ATP-binding protein n=1 Tax=Streptomyces sp. NBC_00237 TaxID=2975687 RepID=UPI002250615A|nr:ATP-binding protein [Streptomyces sp. NBC_00237]MCX5206069.1 ATP-binding protein [Streptomyces sp. NBC_00237]